MNLVNKQVTHESFGKGNVVKYNDSYVKIHFASGHKRFIFPDAFGTYLRLVDQRAANLVGKMIEKKEKKRKEAALELEKKKVLEYEQQHRLKQEKSMENRKNDSRLQSVFWCKAQELDRIFAEWSVFTGVIKSGQKKGQPRQMARINQKSACLLTARDPDMSEKDRYILGAFMVDETFSGRLCENGYIPAHPEYRLRLSEQESEKMLFWNYYVNRRYPHKMTWNSGRQRYFDNIWMAQILRDIVSLKEKPQEREDVQLFFEYFCQINRINEEELAKPNGALMRI